MHIQNLEKMMMLLQYYKKSANHFPEDVHNSAEAFSLLHHLLIKSERQMKQLNCLKRSRRDIPNTQAYNEADKYLAILNVFN